MWHKDYFQLPINGTHNLLLLLVVWFSNELGALNQFDVLKLSNLVIKFGHGDLAHDHLLKCALPAILFEREATKEGLVGDLVKEVSILHLDLGVLLEAVAFLTEGILLHVGLAESVHVYECVCAEHLFEMAWIV